jgi:hypothetical protein
MSVGDDTIQDIQGLETLNDRVESEKTAPPVSILNPDSVPFTTEYEQALEVIGRLVNNSDTTFKRDHVGVTWKNLSVSNLTTQLIVGKRRWVWRDYE